MDKEKELYTIKYTFAPYEEENPKESTVYIGAFSPEEARRIFGEDLQNLNKKYRMFYKFEVKEVHMVDCGTDKISLQSLEQKV